MFEYVVDDVFRITGRGTAIVGAHPSEGEFLSGDVIEVLRDGHVVVEAPAFVEMHVRPGMVSLVVADIAADVQAGDVVRRRA